MDFGTVKEKAAELFEDTREGLSIMDRYLVKHCIRTRTIVTDTKTGKKISDTEDGYTREFSLLKALVIISLAIVFVLTLFASLCSSAKQKKTIKNQKKIIRKMEKACKKANVEIEE